MSPHAQLLQRMRRYYSTRAVITARENERRSFFIFYLKYTLSAKISFPFLKIIIFLYQN